MSILKEIHPGSAFADLLNKPEDFEFVSDSIEHTIWQSFAVIDVALYGEDKVKPTQAEIKHRFEICEGWFRVMRAELGFGLKRTLDMIPKALASSLLGQSFDPEAEGEHGWFADRLDIGVDLEKL